MGLERCKRSKNKTTGRYNGHMNRCRAVGPSQKGEREREAPFPFSCAAGLQKKNKQLGNDGWKMMEQQQLSPGTIQQQQDKKKMFLGDKKKKSCAFLFSVLQLPGFF